jgi:hypothetical protein
LRQCLLHAVGGHATVRQRGVAMVLIHENLGASKVRSRRFMLLKKQRAFAWCMQYASGRFDALQLL